MNKIKCFIECLLPVTACNLKCDYCYIIQRDQRKLKIPQLKYSPEIIGKCLSVKRFGGTCYFSICGAGETLIPQYTIPIVKNILEQGHFVNITTNGTLTQRFEELFTLPNNLLERLNISFSFHYIELKRLNLLDVFFDNILKCKKNNISFVVQIQLCDEYIKHIDEIKRICFEKIGAYPQVAATRKENKNLKEFELLTDLSEDEYILKGKEFNSPLFDFTMKNFNVKRKEFCYAGDWSFVLNLLSGKLCKCYGMYNGQNIFENPNKKIKFEAIGTNCPSKFCLNSSHFMSFGVIPSIVTPNYGDLRNREEANWYSSLKIIEAFSSKLQESNKEYSKFKKIYINIKNKILICFFGLILELKKIIKAIRRKHE